MLKVSKGNSKLGAIYNINLPAGVTCAKDAPCRKQGCYAMKGNYRFSNVMACYAENLRTYIDTPHQALSDILLQLPHVDNDYFTLHTRWHSAGDIVDAKYLHMMVRVANERPYMKFLAFTKKYDLVNSYIEEFGELPKNLCIVFSHWKGFKICNPYNMPVAIVAEFNELEINKQAFSCTGKCELCFRCWNMEKGEQVIFNKH